MSIWIRKLSLRISLHHPLIDSGRLTTAVQDLIDIVPSHRMNFNWKLMLHLLILILWLPCQNWEIGRYIPTPDNKISATSNEHIVLGIINVNHIQ